MNINKEFEKNESDVTVFTRRGVALMAFILYATDRNQKVTQVVNKIIALARQHGYQSEPLLRKVLDNSNVDMGMLSDYVDSLFEHINDSDVINLMGASI